MRQHKLFYGSSYDRGLEFLLMMWPEVKKAIPSATLDICYGWDLFLSVMRTNPERMAWKEKMDKLMSQPGITHHGRVGKKELKKIRNGCGIWAYPTNFTEINCITALEAQRDGLVPVVINLAALKETVGSGVKVEGDIYFDEVYEEYLQQLINTMRHETLWKKESKKAREFAESYNWDNISEKWEEQF